METRIHTRRAKGGTTWALMDISFETMANMDKEYKIAMNISLAKFVPNPLLKYKSRHNEIHTKALEDCHISTASAAPNNPTLGTRVMELTTPIVTLTTTIKEKLLGGLMDWIVDSQGELISIIAHETRRMKKILDDSVYSEENTIGIARPPA